MIRQLTFDLTGSEALTRADFFVAPSNALALQTVEGWQDWPGGKLILLGPEPKVLLTLTLMMVSSG